MGPGCREKTSLRTSGRFHTRVGFAAAYERLEREIAGKPVRIRVANAVAGTEFIEGGWFESGGVEVLQRTGRR